MVLNPSIFTLLCIWASTGCLPFRHHSPETGGQMVFLWPWLRWVPRCQSPPRPTPPENRKYVNESAKTVLRYNVLQNTGFMTGLSVYSGSVIEWLQGIAVSRTTEWINAFWEEMFSSTKSKQYPYGKAHLSQHRQFTAFLPPKQEETTMMSFSFQEQIISLLALTIIHYKAHRTTKRLR